MASAYKSASRGVEDSDFESISGEESSRTLSAHDSSDDNDDDDDESGEDDEQQHQDQASRPVSKSTTPLESLRNRILMLTSRGISYRHRHLLNDLTSLLPHTYKDTKLDTKSSNRYNETLNALADLHSCNYVFFLEARKRGQDLYLWLAGAPNGPTVKFSVSNIHTMAELEFGGNCLKGGRGVVVFDKSFDDGMQGFEHKTLIMEMLRGVFCVPSKGVRGMKPFIDRIIAVYGLDGKIWIRIYEIRETHGTSASGASAGTSADENLPRGAGRTNISLVEIGPRMTLTPILILEGSFGGPVIYENKQYVSPNQLRSQVRLRKASKFVDRRNAADERIIKKKSLGLESGFKKPRSKLDNSELFA